MGSADDQEYRKSVRNMSIVLAAIVITVFAALIIPPYISPVHESFQKQVSVVSPLGFMLSLEVNATSLVPSGLVTITGWINSTSARIENFTSADSWAVDHSRLWGRTCTNGWPIGVGVMKGHYTSANYTSGTLILLPQPQYLCPVNQATPGWFALPPHSSKALVSISGTPELWVIQSTIGFGPYSLAQSQLPRGVYTVVAADEWGDVLLTNFIVS